MLPATTAYCGLLSCQLPVLRPTMMTDLQHLRNEGLREANLYQVVPANAPQLIYLQYADGSLRLNIWKEPL